MAIFRSKSKQQNPKTAANIDVKISSKDEEQFQINSGSVHDPILTAVNEAQPFEQAVSKYDNRRPSYLSTGSHDLKDIFGNPIDRPDISNPTRSRNERPLDTIRGFEYAITGDLTYREQLETSRLGWGFHEDFPHYNLQQQATSGGDPNYEGGNAATAIFNNNNDQAVYQGANYSASSLRPEGKKKKRGGLFGRKK